MSWSGTLTQKELGGATVHVLETDDGPFELRGPIDPALIGRRVRVEGRREEPSWGFAMSGPVIRVRGLEVER